MAFSSLGSLPVQPLYIKNRDIYQGGNDYPSDYEICSAVAEVVGSRNVDIAQKLKMGVWRIYVKNNVYQ